MSNYAVKPVSTPLKVSVTRIENIFQASNPYIFSNPIIKDYIYIESRRIIA